MSITFEIGVDDLTLDALQRYLEAAKLDDPSEVIGPIAILEFEDE